MKQVIQNFKSGELNVQEVPVPALHENMVLVENRFSLISSGTEKGTVKVGKANLLNKARQRPDLVAQVLQNIKKEGLKATLEKVRTKLDAPKALGYSTAGVVVASMDSGKKLQPGDRVACAGQDYASHAEVVSVPRNLVARIPDNVSFEEASFTTVGAIALQGVRQADPKIGEKVCVIGLGLIGQLTCQLLKANGCDVLGIDLDEFLVNMAREHSTDKAFLRRDSNLATHCQQFTQGNGFDAVIITAATTSNDPIELAAELLKRKGKVIIVGAVKMDIPREPFFYKKELELRMSCSYGPGRYDPDYEENGNDYPFDYVRWTEQRNMDAFLNLISKGLLNIKPFISEVFPIDQANVAYDQVLNGSEKPFVGLLLEYAERKEKFNISIKTKGEQSTELCVGFIGAGSFAQSYLIPQVASAGIPLHTVVTSKGPSANNVAGKFGFTNASTNPQDITNDPGVNVVFIATQHDTHARFVIECLKAGKQVFVEKPLALTLEELSDINDTYKDAGGILMVGYNRRFAPLSKKVEAIFQNSGPKVINIRVNAGVIPANHWIQDKKKGGGRILGEVCHFIDLLQYYTGSQPVRVSAEAINNSANDIQNEDNLSITLRFQDGSVGNILYTSIGGKSMPKERIEIFGAGISMVINDWKTGTIYTEGGTENLKSGGKGHSEEVHAFFSALKNNTTPPISFESMFYTSYTTLKIHDALQTGLPQDI